jgi:Holliday junction resolvasome RuvABC DNA-binding subunit
MSSDILLNPISPLRHVRFGSLLPRVGGGGGGSAPASQTVTQTNIPEYAAPYFERLLERAESVYGTDVPYEAFPGQRQADLPGDISAAYDVTRQVAGQGIAGLPQAMDVVSGNIQAGQQLAQQAGQPFQFGGTQFEQQGVQPFAGFQEAGADQFQFDPTQRFTGAAVQEYMSPYMQNVVDEQSRRAIQQFQEQRGGRAAQAVSAGAFGGSRQAVQESLAERDLMDRLSGIQATGSQQAFEQAAQMFGQDRGAEFARQQAQAGELARAQGIGTQEAARVQAAQASELARAQGIDVAEAGRVQAAQAAEQARIQAAQAAENRAAQQSQLQALGFSAEQAQQMVGFGEAGRAADIQGAQLLENIGRSQLGREQEARDIAYQDFVAQRAFPEQQLQGISSILRGVPVQPGTTTTSYAPFNPLQQALGAGLGAIGLYRGLSG